jgi:alkaline phosphatase
LKGQSTPKASLKASEDATVYANGPWAYLFSGNYEQNFIAHAISYSACLEGYCGFSNRIQVSGVLLVVMAFVTKLLG